MSLSLIHATELGKKYASDGLAQRSAIALSYCQKTNYRIAISLLIEVCGVQYKRRGRIMLV
jgi:hypothetical protein